MRRSTSRVARARRSAAVAALALAAGLGVLGAAPSSASDGDRPPGPPAAPPSERAADPASEALARARDALSGPPVAQDPAAERTDATLALRDLFAARQDLSAPERRAADRILARPTNPGDYDAYTVASRRTCSTTVCVHWVPRTADAPPSRAWVDLTLRTMNAVWAREIGGLGYRRPASDGTRGGNRKLDVYLSDVGADGLYGYCQTERTVAGAPRRASGYCVLDDDFARAQFGAVPRDSLQVTAAHEFAHASQFNYDYLEDSWFMEATATWMEERVYDAVNDNRQYLRAGQVGSPDQPLDVFDPRGSNQYGNWAFFEHLSSRWGVGIVREAWNHAGGVGAPNQYSTEAVKSVLAARGGFPAVYSAFAAANTRPAQTYEEGAAWPSAPVASTWTIGSSDRTRQDSALVDHLAARNLRAVPGATLGAGWQLRVVVDGPAADTSPTASVTVDRTGDLPTQTSPVPLDADGRGTATVAFDPTSVDDVTVTLANASTRFACHQGTYLSCEGSPRDDDGAFTLQVVALQP